MLIAATLSTAPLAVATTSESPFMRGMVVSCPRAGQIWGSPEMAETLRELTSLGVGWVAIHPYGWVKNDGSVRFQPAADLPFLAKAVALADGAGMELFWKPHLGYWGSFPHRGAIDFGENPAQWARFFREYEDFIVDQATFAEAAGVDLFAVGAELEGTVHYEDLWRRIICEVLRYRDFLTHFGARRYRHRDNPAGENRQHQRLLRALHAHFLLLA
jgi:hypothetical protein